VAFFEGGDRDVVNNLIEDFFREDVALFRAISQMKSMPTPPASVMRPSFSSSARAFAS
jgi:hypothetical protein